MYFNAPLTAFQFSVAVVAVMFVVLKPVGISQGAGVTEMNQVFVTVLEPDALVTVSDTSKVPTVLY